MITKRLCKIINNKNAFVYLALVVSILILASSVNALAPSCHYPDGSDFDGTWKFLDARENGNDFSITCRQGKLTGICVDADNILGGAGPYPGVYWCEGETLEVGCEFAGTNDKFSGTWVYLDDAENGNDFALTCRSGGLSAFCLNPPALSTGRHDNIYSCEGSETYSARESNLAGLTGNWQYLDARENGNDFSIDAVSGELKAFCVDSQYPIGKRTGFFGCFGNDKDNDGYDYLTDCDDNNPEKYRTVVLYKDNDKDNYGSGNSISMCIGKTIPYGYSTNNLDCNDNNFLINPNAMEICDGIDNNCNSLIDESYSNCGQGKVCSNGQCINPNPVCSFSSDCGTNGFTGTPVCQSGNLFQNYKTFFCNNAGTSSSFCSSSTSLQLKQSCSYGCSNNQCNPAPSNETNPPIINVISPLNDAVLIGSPKEIEFLFNVQDESSIKSCSLNVSNQIINNSTAISKTSSNSIKITLNQGNYSGFIYCFDEFNNKGISPTINFRIQNQTSDTTPPGSITGLYVKSKTSNSILWKWTNPADSDFCSNIIYINGVHKATTSSNYYKATGLSANTSYKITVHTKDCSGNVNNTDVSNTAKTNEINRDTYIMEEGRDLPNRNRESKLSQLNDEGYEAYIDYSSIENQFQNQTSDSNGIIKISSSIAKNIFPSGYSSVWYWIIIGILIMLILIVLVFIIRIFK